MENFTKMEFFSREEFNIPGLVEGINKKDGWVNWGVDNLLPEYFKGLLLKSSIHSSIVKHKAMSIGGRGWDRTGLSDEALLFINNIFNEDDLDEILFKIAYDLEVYGGFNLNIVWSKTKSKISEINYIDPSKVRIKPSEDNMQDGGYFVCDDWCNYRKVQPVLYQGFSTSNKKQRSQILYVKDYFPGSEWYAIPEYISGIESIETAYKVKRWHLNNVNNGFAPDMHINFPIGNPSEEEAHRLIRGLKEQFKGEEKAGNQVITFSKDKDSAVSFNDIELNASDSRFLLLDDSVKEDILKAHRVTNPKIFGINSPSGLGNNKNEMIEAMELFTVQYIEPKQKMIEKIFNWLARQNGIKDTLLINKYEPQFSKVTTNINDILSILTADISPDQKYNLLLANEYNDETAKKITGYDPDKIINTTDGTTI